MGEERVRGTSAWLPLALCLAGAVVAWLEPRGTAGVAVRTIALIVLMAPMPGWPLARAADLARDWLELTVASLLTSLALLGAIGFFWTAVFGGTWTLHAMIITIVGVTLATSVVGLLVPPRSRPVRGATGLAVALVVAVSASAAIVHAVVPAASQESAFSFELSSGHLTPEVVSVTVNVHELGHAGPGELVLSAEYHTISYMVINGPGTYTLTGRRTQVTGSLCDDLIKITAPNSSYITPVLPCSAATGTS